VLLLSREIRSRAGLEYRSEEMLEASTNANVSTNHRKQRQDAKRRKHDPWALMGFAMPMSPVARFVVHRVSVSRLMFHVMRSRAAPVFASESEKHQSEHVEGSDESGDDADQPIHPIPTMSARIGLPKNLILGEEACKTWDSSNG
jgi:hypothetical protein